MRPTSIMLQQNNNNNYPCLNMSGSNREMLQKCSRPSLPFPSRLELGLGDLPLIRGLRAWALCSKNRCKAGGVLGGLQAPTAPPAGQGSSTLCPRPADVYLRGEWDRMGYGLPLGLDARQAGIGALVTVASLKTSEGSGKTQTQCLFLRTEKGNCLYSTAKPGCRAINSNPTVSSGVGGWLRGKTGGRDNPVGRKDNRPNLMMQPGANRARVRSGRKWRKSGNVAGREKASVSIDRQQRSREGPAGERQEEQDKGCLDSLQQESKRGRQEKEAVCRSPRSFYSVSPKTYAQCGRRAQRREDEGVGGENSNAGVPSSHNSDVKGMRKEMQKNEEEEDEEGGLCELESSNSVLESNCLHPQSLSGCDGEGNRDVSSNEELKMQTSDSVEDISEKEQDPNSGVMKEHIRNNDSIHVHSGHLTDSFTSRHNSDFSDRESTENPSEEILANVNGFSDEESQKEIAREEGNEEERSIKESPYKFSDVSTSYEDVSLSTHLSTISTTVSSGSSTPAEGSICSADHETVWVKGEQETDQEGGHPKESDPATMGAVGFGHLEPNCVAEENNNVKPQLFFQNEENSRQVEESEASPSPLRHAEPCIAGTTTENRCKTNESQWRHEEQENKDKTRNPEEGIEAEEVWRREHACRELDISSVNNETGVGVTLEGNYEKLKKSRSSEGKGRPQKGSGEDVVDTCAETKIPHVEEDGEISANMSHVACANRFTSQALSLVNPDPSLGSMATCVQEEVEEGVELRAAAEDGGQKLCRRERELEELDEEERGSTLATEDIGKEEEEEEGEDEFGVFMQAEEEPAWSEGVSVSGPVPCGSKTSVALGNHTLTAESTHWTPGWTDGSFHQSDDTWTAFPQASPDGGGDIVGQWWPRSAVRDRRDGRSANQSVESVFAESFPSLPDSSSSDHCDLGTVPTLTQLLRGRTNQDQGLLDSFHDLNKMIGQRFKRASGVSHDLLLTTLRLQQPHTESRATSWTANHRLSPSLPSANRHAQNAVAKRRLSCDHNRNIVE